MSEESGITKRERTRAQILQAAATLFAESGYSGVSMDGLGKACRLTKGALYDHFNGKDDVYTQCVAHYVKGAISDIFSQSLTGDDSSAEAKLFSFLENFLTRLQDDVVLRRLLQRLLMDAKGVDLAVDLLSQYKPSINAKTHIYSFFCSAIMGEDLRAIADLLSPEFKGIPATQAMLEHFRGVIR
jgi:AcrR family transcriptional regulator